MTKTAKIRHCCLVGVSVIACICWSAGEASADLTLLYTPGSGNGTLQASAGWDILGFELENAAGVPDFNLPVDFSGLPAGLEEESGTRIAWTSLTAFVDSSANLGSILPTGFDQSQLDDFLTVQSYTTLGASGTIGITVVPEPSLLPLAIIGILGLVVDRRKRRTRK